VTRSPERRDQIIDALADHVLAHGLAGSSLRPLAAAAGLSDRMLLYHFHDKSEAMAAAAERIAARLTVRLGAVMDGQPLPLDALRIRLAHVLMADDLWPYMKLWLELASGAARGDAFCLRMGKHLGHGFLAWGAAQLDCDEADRTHQAALLLASLDGLFILKAVGMDAAVAVALAPRC
jgi:AcrR family transcriptional regulator